MQTIWIIFVSLGVLGLCSGLPISASTESSAAPWLVGTLLLLGAALITVGGCLCCKKKRGFQEFKDETLSSTSTLNAQAQFPIFRPLDQTTIQNQQCYIQNEQSSPPARPSSTANASNIQSPLLNTQNSANVIGVTGQSQSALETPVNNGEHTSGFIQNVQNHHIAPQQSNANNAGREENNLQMNVQSTSSLGNAVENQSHFSNIVSSSLAFASNNLEALRHNIQLISNNVDDNNDYDYGDNNNGPISELDIQNIANNNAEGYIRNQNEILAEENIIQEVIPIRPTVDSPPISHENNFAGYSQPEIINIMPSTSSSSASTFINIETHENTFIDEQNQVKENSSLPLNCSYKPETNVSLVHQSNDQKYHNLPESPKASETNYSNVSNIVSSKIVSCPESQVPMVTDDIIVDVEDVNLGFQEYISDTLNTPALKVNNISTNIPKDVKLENISSVATEKLGNIKISDLDTPLVKDCSAEEFISENEIEEHANKNDSLEENENIKLSISSEDSDSGVNEALRVLESVLSGESDGESSNTSLEDIKPNFEDSSESRNDESYFTITEHLELKREIEEDNEVLERLFDDELLKSKSKDTAKAEIDLSIENKPAVQEVIPDNVCKLESVNIIDSVSDLHLDVKNQACSSDKGVEIVTNKVISNVDSHNVKISLNTANKTEESIFLGNQLEKELDNSTKIATGNIIEDDNEVTKVISDVIIKKIENEDIISKNNKTEYKLEGNSINSDVKSDININEKSDTHIKNESSCELNMKHILKEEPSDTFRKVKATSLEQLQKVENYKIDSAEGLIVTDPNIQFIETEIHNTKYTEQILEKPIIKAEMNNDISNITESVSNESLLKDDNPLKHEDEITSTATNNKPELINDTLQQSVTKKWIEDNESNIPQVIGSNSQYEVKFIEVTPKPLNNVQILTNKSIEDKINLVDKFDEPSEIETNIQTEQIVNPTYTVEEKLHKENSVSLDATEKNLLGENSLKEVSEEILTTSTVQEGSQHLKTSGYDVLEIENNIASDKNFVNNITNPIFESTTVKLHRNTSIPEIIIDECFDNIEDDEYEDDLHEDLSDCVKDEVVNIKETDSGVVSIDEVSKVTKCDITKDKQDSHLSEHSISEDMEMDKSVESTDETIIVKLYDNVYDNDVSDESVVDSKKEDEKDAIVEQTCDVSNANDATFTDCDRNSNNDKKSVISINEMPETIVASVVPDSKIVEILEEQVMHENSKDIIPIEHKLDTSRKVSEQIDAMLITADDFESNKENESLNKTVTKDVKNNVIENTDSTKNKENEKSLTKPSKYEAIDRCKDFLLNEQDFNSKIRTDYNNKQIQNEAIFTSTPLKQMIKTTGGNLQKALFLKSISPTHLNDEDLGLNKLEDTDSLEEGEQTLHEINVNYFQLKSDNINLESWDKFLVDSFEQNVSDHDSSEIFETNDINNTASFNQTVIENKPDSTFEVIDDKESTTGKGFFLHPQKSQSNDLEATYELKNSESDLNATFNYATQNHNDESQFLDATYDTKQADEEDTYNDKSFNRSLDLNGTYDVNDEKKKIEEIRRKLTDSLPNAQGYTFKSLSDDEGIDLKDNKFDANFEPEQGSSHFPDFESFSEDVKTENQEGRQELVIRYNECNPSRRFLSPIMEEWDGEKEEENNIDEDSDDVFEDNKILSSDTDRTFILNETRCLDSTSFSEQNVTSSDKPRPVLASWCSNDTLFNVEDNFETNGQNDTKPADVESRDENINKNEELNEKIEQGNSSTKDENVIFKETEEKTKIVLDSELSEQNILHSDRAENDILEHCTDEESKNQVKDSGNVTDENMSSIIDNIETKFTETSKSDIAKDAHSTNDDLIEKELKTQCTDTDLQLAEKRPNLTKNDSGLEVSDINVINIPIYSSSAETTPEHKVNANSRAFEESTLVTLSDKTDQPTADIQDDEVLSELDDLSSNSEPTCSKSEEYKLHNEDEDNNIENENGFNLNGENDPWITDVKYSDIMMTSFSSESPNLTPLSPNLSPKISPNIFRNDSLENIIDEDTGWESEDTSGEFEWRAGDFESATNNKTETDSKNKSAETTVNGNTIESKRTVQKDMISEDIEIEDLEENVVTFNNILHRTEPLSSINSDINYQPIDDFESQNENNGDNEESCSESSEEMEFIPSSWDAFATPSRSSMKSPEKSNSGPKKQRSVVFKQEKYLSVYEYPREQEQCSYIEEPNVASMFTINPMDDDDVQDAIRGSYYNRFFVTSSSMPFARSQFTVPPQESVVDSNTEPFSWSQYDQYATEDFLRESEVDETSLESSSVELPKKCNNDQPLIDLSESENPIIDNAQSLENINNQEHTHDQLDSDNFSSDNTKNPFKENVTVIRVNDNNFFENYSPFEQNDQYGPMSANFWLTDEISTSFMSPETPEINVNNFNSAKTNISTIEHLNQLSDFLTPDSGIEITPNPDNGSKNLINFDNTSDAGKILTKDEMENTDCASCEDENMIKNPPNVDNLGILCHTKSQLKLPLKCEQNYESKERTLEDGNIFDLDIDEPNLSFSDNIESVPITEPDAYIRHNVTFSTFGKTNTPPKKSNNLIELEVCQTDLPIINNSSSLLNSETAEESSQLLTNIELQQFAENSSIDNNFKNKATVNDEMKDKFILFKTSVDVETKSNGFEANSNDFGSVNSGDEDSGIDSAATFIDITGKSS